MSSSGGDDAEAEANRLRLKMHREYSLSPGQPIIDIETTNSLDMELWPGTPATTRLWFRDQNDEGSGKYGIVYKSYCKKESGSRDVLEVRALKVIRKEVISTTRADGTTLQLWKREIRALIHFSKPEVCSLVRNHLHDIKLTCCPNPVPRHGTIRVLPRLVRNS